MEIVIRCNISGIGKKIRELRAQSTKSATKLAADAEISSAQWYKIEAEEIPVKFEMLEAIAQSLGVCLEDLGVSVESLLNKELV